VDGCGPYHERMASVEELVAENARLRRIAEAAVRLVYTIPNHHGFDELEALAQAVERDFSGGVRAFLSEREAAEARIAGPNPAARPFRSA
jgi:hypothetical protein